MNIVNYHVDMNIDLLSERYANITNGRIEKYINIKCEGIDRSILFSN